MTKYYLRQGAWCLCERSCNTAEGRLEDGVSAFECQSIAPEKWEGVGAAFEKRLGAHRGQRHVLGVGAPFFLVTGKVVGAGGDREPLLKEVEAHRAVQWDGTGCFVEVGPCRSEQVKSHPDYPECRCYGVDELDQLDEYESLQENGTDPEGIDSSDIDSSDIEF